MPRGKDKRTPVSELSPAELDYARQLVIDPRFAHAEVFRIEHRDRVGVVCPLIYNAAQESAYRTIQRIRSFNLARSLRYAGLLSWACTILGVPSVVGETKLRPWVDAIEAFGPDAFLLECALAEITPDVTDSPVHLLVGKPRKEGLSTLIEALGAHRAMFIPRYRVLVMAHEREAGQNLLSMTHRFYLLWPRGPHPTRKEIRALEVFRPEVDTLARDGIAWPQEGHGSRFVVQTAGGADSNRSFHFDFIHLSEYAHYPSFAPVSALSTGAPKHAWVIKESTANGASGPFYQEWKEALYLDEVIDAYDRGDAEVTTRWNNGFIKWFFPWVEDPHYSQPIEDWEREHFLENLDEFERSLKARFPELTLGQLKWRRWRISNAQNHDTLTPQAFFAQEYPADETEMFQSTGGEVFDRAQLALMESRSKLLSPIYLRVYDDLRPPERVHASLANCIVWEPPEPGAFYVIGADVSQGTKEGDWCDLRVLHRTDGTVAREVCRARGKFAAVGFGDLITMFAEWYNEAFVVPEVNGPGIATCTRIAENLYPNMYHRQVLDLVSDARGGDNTFRFGFHVNVSTKNGVVERLRQAIREGAVMFRCPVLINEARNYKMIDGKYGKAPGETDDAVDAVGLAYFGHASGVAAPVTRRAVEKRRERERKVSEETASIWDQIRRKDKKIQKALKKKLRGEYRSGA